MPPARPSAAPQRPDLDSVTPLTHNPTRIVRFPSIDPAVSDDVALAGTATPKRPSFKRQTYVRRPKLGEVLLDMGVINGSDLARALILQRRLSARLGDVLIRRNLVDEDTLAQALGRQRGMGRAGHAPLSTQNTNTLARKLPLDVALKYRALPWRRVGGKTLIATSRPELVDELRAALPASMGVCLFAVATDSALEARLHEVHGASLARAAECRVPESISCRSWRPRSGSVGLAAAVAMIFIGSVIWPYAALQAATAVALLVMALNLGLRFAAAIALWRTPKGFASIRPAEEAARRLPCISVLVPLHREPEIAGPLTDRLSRLDYPRELLDICLVVEADDRQTLDALGRANLPNWMRVIPVPDGRPRTKPRAMNYALNFTRGSIVGIYDAEDAPAPDQLLTVATRFQSAPANVACLQGRLDYYNPKRNWMSRCFTIEYANWFRLILPGIARLGLVVPLGGTTLFFRRHAIETVGGWDAHNVTEDADLGVRLARMGFRTEIIDTTTLEEANASPLAWVKQRSRWMKGYILTWAVHSRRPKELWHDLGTRRFLGFHLLFMGAVLNALLTPVLWSTVIVAFGVHHPILDLFPGDGQFALGIFLALALMLSMGLACIGCRARHHRHLRKWIPTLELYFPLATLAVIKALAEIVLKPFHWDKTTHGILGGTPQGEISALEQQLTEAGGAPKSRLPHGG